MNGQDDSVRAAEDLVANGHSNEAIALLAARTVAGDRDAAFLFARWHLAGKLVPRDLPRAELLFRQAAEAGHVDARRIAIAFLAHGAAGSRNWRAALQQLTTLAQHDEAAARECDLIAAMGLNGDGEPSLLPPAETLHQASSVRFIRGLLTVAECTYLIDRATPLLRPSVVIDPQTGRTIPSPIRTSDGAAFPLIDESPAIHALNRRFAAVSGSDVRAGEPLQILRYRIGQEYRPHMDALPHSDNQRSQTLLVYLNDDYRGGETDFPRLGISVRGRPGDALLFQNALPDGRPDLSTIHAGQPVLAGTKLIASRWIRARQLDLSGRYS